MDSRNGTRQPHAGNCSVDMRVEEVQQAGREDHADRHADLRVGAEEAALALGSVLHGHQCGAAPFTAGGEALQDPEQDEQDRGPDADLGVGGQHADQGGGGTHQDQGEDQHRLAAEPVAQVAGDDRAERPEQEADADGGEGEDLRQPRVRGVRCEEQRRQQRGRGLGIDEEVVPLDGGADERPARTLRSSCLLLGPASESTDEVTVIGTPLLGAVVLPNWVRSG